MADTGFAGYIASLAGDWQLRRRYGDGSRFKGVARFTKEPGSMALSETGTLYCAGGEALAGCRSWVWRLEGPDRLQISFRDPTRNGVYHHIPVHARAKRWFGGASHDCGGDLYRGWYVFDIDRITVRQSVTGPHKNYTFVTKYLRMRRN